MVRIKKVFISKLTSWNSYNLQPANAFTILELTHFHDSVNMILCFILSSITRVAVPFWEYVIRCFPVPIFIEKIFIFVFQGNYATPLLILFIAIILLKSFSYIFRSENKSEDIELPPYDPLQEHLNEVQYWLNRGAYWYAKELARQYRVREYFHWPE